MSTLPDTSEPPVGQPFRGTLGRVGLTVMGVVAAVTTLVSAATVWLLLTRPLAVADALGEHEATEMARALAGLMMSMLHELVRYL